MTMTEAAKRIAALETKVNDLSLKLGVTLGRVAALEERVGK